MGLWACCFQLLTEIAHPLIIFLSSPLFLRALCSQTLSGQTTALTVMNYISIWRNESGRSNACPECTWDPAAAGVYLQDNVAWMTGSWVFFFKRLKNNPIHNLNNSAMHYHCLVGPDVWQLLTKQVIWAITQIRAFRTDIGTEQLKHDFARVIKLRHKESGRSCLNRPEVKLTCGLN